MSHPAVSALLIVDTLTKQFVDVQRYLGRGVEQLGAEGASVYIAEGNRSQALRQFERYRSLMDEELDLEPSRDIAELISGVRTH